MFEERTRRFGAGGAARSFDATRIRDVLRGPSRALAPPERHRFEQRLSAGAELVQAAPRAGVGELLLSEPSDAAEREADRFSAGLTGPSARPGAGPELDLGSVRIHTDERAAEAAQSLGAAAFTVGRDVVFDRDQYRPDTPRGDALMAHELAHVAQARQVGPSSSGEGFAVQRRKSDYPADKDSKDYSVLKPKKLNPRGPFSGGVLNLVSGYYTDSSKVGGRRTAELVLEILESSPTFVLMARALDDFYAKDTNPGFWIGFEHLGSKFIPQGSLFRTKTHLSLRSTAPSVDVMATATEDMILIDASSSKKMFAYDDPAIAGLDEQRAVAFAEVLIHEAVHAYRRVLGLGGAGLKGFIKEERDTRLGARSVLLEVAKATKNKTIASEARAAADAAIAGGNTMAAVARSLASGDRVTYLEKFYLGRALDLLLPKYKPEGTDVEETLSGPPPTWPELGDVEHLKKYLVAELVTLSSPKPKPEEPSVAPSPEFARDAGSTGTKKSAPPPEKKAPPKKKTPPPWLLGASDKAALESLVVGEHTLAELLTLEGKLATVKGASERALYYYALIFRVREIFLRLADEHAKATLAPSSPAYAKLCTELALKYLGLKKAYDPLGP
jgi:hypothetical protein